MDRKIGQVAESFRRFRHLDRLCFDRHFSRTELSKVTNPALLFKVKYTEEGPITQKQIAEILGVAPPTVAVSVKRMEKAGLVRKIANQDDLRENYIELTDYGRDLTDRCEAVAKTIHRGMLRDFTEEELDTLNAFFRRIISNMEEISTQPHCED